MIQTLMKLLKIKFSGELILKDGTPIIINGDLDVGAKVDVNGPDGIMPLPDGNYELETGQIITVEKGLITDIVDQVETPENPDVEKPIEVEEAKPVDEPEAKPDEEKPAEETPEDPMKKIEDKLSELEQKIKELEAKTAQLSSDNENLSKDLKDGNEKINLDIETIKQKASFVKELPKSTSPDVSEHTSPLVDKINKIREMKKIIK